MKHRFFVPTDGIRGDSVTFAEEQGHQMRSVLRLHSGDQVRVFDGVSRVDRVVELSEPTHGRIIGECAQAAEPGTKLVVYPALLQRDKFESVLQKLTEVGAAVIVPVLSARSLVREPPDERREARWRAILREAAEQSGRGVVPDLAPTQRYTEAIATAQGTRIVAYEGERQYLLSDALAHAEETVSLFVGPEGGYERAEAECARTAGARLVTLGPRVLRSETASPVLAALVLYELEQQA